MPIKFTNIERANDLARELRNADAALAIAYAAKSASVTLFDPHDMVANTSFTVSEDTTANVVLAAVRGGMELHRARIAAELMDMGVEVPLAPQPDEAAPSDDPDMPF